MKVTEVAPQRGGQRTVPAATPFWFGSTSRPLFGWMHLPAGGFARGGVVLFPPLAIEHICTYFTYRTLATRLAAAGLAVVRFDYDGTGDSYGGEDDPDRVQAWLASGAQATDVLKATGVTSVALVGIRMGGIFAARAAAEMGGVDALVLWDTCLSGRAFLREQQALRLLSLGGTDTDGSIEAPGLRFGPETVADLTGLDLGPQGHPLARDVLVLEHPGRPRPSRLVRRLEGADTTWIEAVNQEAFLDPPRQETPVASLAAVSDWLIGHVGGDEVPVEPPVSGSAIVGRTADGSPVRERPVSFGSAPLFGIVTEPEVLVPGPAILLVDEGNTPHVGQSRLWVDVARVWGALGLRVLRFDLSGNGDSAAHPGQEPHGVRDLQATGDVAEAMAWMSPDDPRDSVLVGICAGAYQSMETALVAPPRRVCLINPAVNFIPPETDGGRLSAERRAVQSSPLWMSRLAHFPLKWLGKRMGPRAAEHGQAALVTGSWPLALANRCPAIPAAVWRVVVRALVRDTPAQTFERLTDAGVETYVVCGPDDAPHVQFGNERLLARLSQRPEFRFDVLEGLDHAALIVEQRVRLRQVLTDYVLAGGSAAGTR